MYILGRREVFEGCYELREAFELLLERPDKLTLVTGELWPSQRRLTEDVNEAVAGEAVMQGVEHLGQYVFEMTTTKVKQLQAESGLPSGDAVQELVEAQDAQEIEPIPEEDETEADGPAQGFEAEED